MSAKKTSKFSTCSKHCVISFFFFLLHQQHVSARRLHKRDNSNHNHFHKNSDQIYAGGKLSEEDILIDELNAQIVTGVVSIILGSVLLSILIVLMTKIYDKFFCSVSETRENTDKLESGSNQEYVK